MYRQVYYTCMHMWIGMLQMYTMLQMYRGIGA